MSDGNGALPDGWAEGEIGDLVDRITGGVSTKKDDYVSDGVLVLNKGNIKQHGIISFDGPRKYVSHSYFEENQSRALNEGDVVVTLRDLSVKADFLGLIGTYSESQPALLTQGAYRLAINKDVEPEFLIRFSNAPTYRSWVKAHKNGSTQVHLRNGQFLEVPIKVPPLAEQRRIVSKIESLQERSSRARRALSEVGPLLEQFRQSVLRAAFSGRLTADWRAQREAARKAREGEAPAEPNRAANREREAPAEPHTPANGSAGASPSQYETAHELLERIRTERRHRWEQSELAKYEAKGKQPPKNWQDKYKEPQAVDESKLPALPDGWCWASVEQLSEIVEYGSSSKTSEDETAVPVLRMGNIFNGALRFDDLRYLPLDHDEFPRLLLQNGDVLFNRTNSAELVGKTAVFTGEPLPCSFASYLIRTRIILANPHLVAMYINSPYGRDWANSQVSQQVGQANINGTKLKALAVPLPPVAEQTEIHRLLEESLAAAKGIEETKAESESALTQLDQSILAKAFRGELVPQDPRDEPASELLARIRTTRDAEKVKKSSKPRRKKGGTKKSIREKRDESDLVKIISDHGAPMPVTDLLSASGLGNREFYGMLKSEIESGRISEVTGKGSGRYLVVSK